MPKTGTILLASSIVFFLAVVAIGFLTVRWIGHNEDYLFANREVNWWVTGFGVAAVAWAGDQFALIAIFAVAYGLWAGMVPYVAVAVGYVLYGTFFAEVVRAIGSYTIGEFLEVRFDARTRLVVSLYLVIGMLMFLPAGMLGVANILHGFVGWPILPSATAMLAVVGVIILTGGLWGVTVTDIVEAVLGYLLLPVFLLVLVANFGGVEWLVATVPGEGVRFAFPGRFGLDLTSNSYVTWGILWAVMLLFGSPYYWIRAVSARSDAAARRGFQLAGGLSLLLGVFLSLVSLYAFAARPGLFTLRGGPVPPAGAFGVAAQLVPAALGIVFMITIIAANVSTYTTIGLGGITSLSRDFYQRLVSVEADPYEMLTPTRVLTALFVSVGWSLFFFGGVQFYLELGVTFVGISSILTLAGAYDSRVTPDAAFAAAVLGGVTAAGWVLLDPTSGAVHWIYPVIAVMVGAIVVVSAVTRPKYYGDPDWSPDRAAADGGERALGSRERRILHFVRAGANTFGDLIAAVPVDGTLVNETVEALERDGLIAREGTSGAALFTFRLTDAGRDRLDGEAFLEHDGDAVPTDGVEILRRLERATGEPDAGAIAERMDRPVTAVSPYLDLLAETGYVRRGGVFRSRYSLTPAGEALLEGTRTPEPSVAGD